jgi:hypothetical protein
MWLFLTQMFRNGRKNPEHGGDRKTFEVMTSTYPTGTFFIRARQSSYNGFSRKTKKIAFLIF